MLDYTDPPDVIKIDNSGGPCGPPPPFMIVAYVHGRRLLIGEIDEEPWAKEIVARYNAFPSSRERACTRRLVLAIANRTAKQQVRRLTIRSCLLTGIPLAGGALIGYLWSLDGVVMACLASTVLAAYCLVDARAARRRSRIVAVVDAANQTPGFLDDPS